MWYTARYSALLGFLVPIVVLTLVGLERVLETYFWWLGSLAKWLWPSWIMLGATEGAEGTLVGWFIVTISVAVNMAVYALLGALGFLGFWRFFRCSGKDNSAADRRT